MIKCFSDVNTTAPRRPANFDKTFFQIPEMPDVNLPGDVLVEVEDINDD